MKKTWVFILFTAALFILAYISLHVGNYEVSPAIVFKLLIAKIFNRPMPETGDYARIIVLEMRLPRILLAIAAGAVLGMTGAVSQSVFRNPLVSPFILGISSGASLGAAIAIVFFSSSMLALDAFAALGGLLAVLASFFIARKPDGTMPRLSLVLGGVIVSSFASSLVGILKYVADSETQLPAITFWMMGGLESADWETVKPVLFITLPIVILIAVFARHLNILSLGDKEAAFLGMSPEKWKMFFIFLVVVSVGACVARCGVIGWIGLVVPHMARAILGAEHSSSVPLSGLLGAGFLLISDNIARSITTAELPVGIITALIGTPCFIYFLKKREGGVWK